MDDRYLWDGTGPPDPEVERLEKLLGRYRHSGEPPVLPAPARPVRRWLLAAALAAAAAGAVWIARAVSGSWRIETIAGSPQIASRLSSGENRLRVGQTLETDAASRARLRAGIGRIEIAPGSRLRLISSRLTDERLALELGSIRAEISAPPRLFSVETPWATAVDLGCEYTLSVGGDGSGELAVSRGWVELAWAGRESIVTAGDVCATRPGVGPGTPRAEDAPPELVGALQRFDFEPEGAEALPEVLAAARPRDALSLWHLLARTRGDDRIRVYERLSRLSPAPSGVTQEGVLRLDQEMLDVWRFHMGTPQLPRRLPLWKVLWARLTR